MTTETEKAALELDKRVRTVQAEFGLSYSDSMTIVLDNDPDLKARYEDKASLRKYVSAPREHEAGREVDARVREYMEKTGEESYSAAMTAVLSSDEALAQRYNV